MIRVEAGLNPDARTYAKGVEIFHFLSGPLATVVGGEGAAITAFTTVGGAAVWHPFQNEDTQGDIAAVPSPGPGGLEYAVTGNLNIGGSSQAATIWANNFAQSANIPVVAQYRDGTYKYFGKVSLNGGAGMTSGQQGGGANGIALQFGGFLPVYAPDTVTVATDLATITD